MDLELKLFILCPHVAWSVCAHPCWSCTEEKHHSPQETSLGIYWDEHELAQTSKFVLVVRNRSRSYTEKSKAAMVGSENVGLDRPFLLASPLDQVTDLWRGRVARLGKIIVPTSRVIVRNKMNLSATVCEELVQSLGHAKCSV